jgi:hypothetical protein
MGLPPALEFTGIYYGNPYTGAAFGFTESFFEGSLLVRGVGIAIGANSGLVGWFTENDETPETIRESFRGVLFPC